MPAPISAHSQPSSIRYGAKLPAVPLEKLGSSLDAFIPFTQAITEDLFWQWMAVDVIALWMPRIYNSLVRGRTPYNASEDPSFNSKLNEVQQMGKLAKGTFAGLNWRYFGEEASREFLIGPGMLGMMSIMYGLYRTVLNPAIRMPANMLTQLTDTLGQHAQAGPAEQSFKQLMPTFLKSLLSADPAIQPTLQQPLENWAKAWTHTMQATADYRHQYNPAQRFVHAVQHWAETRPFKGQSDKLPNTALKAVIAAEQALQKAETDLVKTVRQFNLYSRPNLHYTGTHQIAVKLQQRVGEGLQARTVAMDINRLLSMLNQWRGLPMAVMHQLQQHPGPISPAVARTLARLTRLKLGAVLTATVITGMYLRGLTFLFQNSKDYPGNRGRHGQDLIKAAS